ncbi:MAG: hypothetical protein FWD66_05900 [Paludibacter sp.]|nr:hypothetical protein [Paludibacter sp.]
MKSQIKIIVLLLILFLSGNLFGNPFTSYKMEITQNSINNFSVKLDITLQDNYCSDDTVIIKFGGLFSNGDDEEEPFDAVSNLTIKSKQNIPFVFDKENSKIKICKQDIKNNKISLEYAFAIILSMSRDEVVTLFYNGMEKPLPVVQNIDSVYFSAKIKTLKILSVCQIITANTQI